MTKSRTGLFLLTAIVVILTRLPFLQAGYGVDPDAWRMAATARAIAATGEYQASRLPAYPIPELAYSLFAHQSPFAFNLCTALFSGLAAGFLALTMRRLGSKDAMLAGIALAFIPIFYISSTVTMDYLWALCFVLAGLSYATDQHPLASGLLLGLATGCRITSVMLAIPLLMILTAGLKGKTRLRSVATFLISLVPLPLLAYTPVMRKYGLGFLQFHEGSYPSVVSIMRTATIDVWGIVGTVAIVTALVAVFAHGKGRPAETSIPSQIPFQHVVAWGVAIVMMVALFMRLPVEAGYLLPILPFVLLLLAYVLKRRFFVLLCIALVCSPMLLSYDAIDRPWSPVPSSVAFPFVVQGRTVVFDVLQGPIWMDRNRRARRMEYAEMILAFADRLDHPGVVVAGIWLPELVVLGGGDQTHVEGDSASFVRGRAEFVGLLDARSATVCRERGKQLYYIPGQQLYNADVFGVNLAEFGAREIR
ncbi:MAG TPA: hypothetical protein VI758_10545 [Bacteroidota bacterium]